MKFTSLLLTFVALSVTSYVSARPSHPQQEVDMVEGLPPTTGTVPHPHLAAREEHLTNAERLRKGLPLNPPHRRSRTLSARDGESSPGPVTTGRLYAMTNNPATSGYVSAMLDSNGRYVVNSDASKALKVTYNNHELIPEENTREQNGPCFGATFGESYTTPPGENNFEGNSYNFAVMTGTSAGSYGQEARKGDTSYKVAPNNFIESAIFTLDSNTNEVLATWINEDGTPRPSQFTLTSSPDGNNPLFISGDSNMFIDNYGGVGTRLFLV